MTLHRVLPLVLLLGSLAASAQDLTTRDNDEVKLLARRKVEKGLADLLNVLSLEDLNESERSALIAESYAPGPNQLFYNAETVVEDDINPERMSAAQLFDLSAEKYLANFDLLYQKAPQATIALSDVAVSNLKRGQWLYVKVFYTQRFGGKHKQIDKPYQPIRRVAEVRADRADKKWVVTIARLGFLAANDSLNAAQNDVALRVEAPRVAILTADTTAAPTPTETEDQKAIRTYLALLEAGEKALGTGELDEALRAFQEAERKKPYDDLTPRARMFKVQRALDERARNSFREVAARAELARRQRRYEEAIGLYRKLVEQKPDSAVLSVQLNGLMEKFRLKSEFDEKFASGKFKELIKDYGRVIDAERKQNRRGGQAVNSSDWYLGRGRSYFMLNEFKDALSDYNESLKLDFQNLATLEARAELYARQGDYPKAVADLTNYLTIAPTSTETLARRADYRARTGRYPEAFTDFDAAIKLDPQNYQLYLRRGLLSLHTKAYPEALAAFSEAVKRTTSQPEPYFYRGFTQALLKRYGEAGSDFAQSTSRNLAPVYVARIDSIAVSFYDYGRRLLNDLKMSDALTAFTIALQVRPGFADAWLEKGKAYLALNQPKPAAEALSTAVSIAPQLHEAYYHRSLSHYRQRLYERAASDARRAYQLVPDYYPALLEEARALIELRRYEQARAGLNTLKAARRQLDALHPKTFLADVYYLLGRSEAELSQPKSALDAFDEALDLHPGRASALVWRGRTYEVLGKPDRAQADYQKALTLETSASVTYALATVLERRERYDEALVRYAQCLQLDADHEFSSDAHQGRGRCFLQLEQYAQAAEEFGKVGQDDGLPCTGECAYLRAYTLVRSGRGEEAVQVTPLNGAKIAPEQAARLWYVLGCAHLQRRQETEALAAFEKSLQNGLPKEYIRKEKLLDFVGKGFRKNDAFVALLNRYFK